MIKSGSWKIAIFLLFKDTKKGGALKSNFKFLQTSSKPISNLSLFPNTPIIGQERLENELNVEKIIKTLRDIKIFIKEQLFDEASEQTQIIVDSPQQTVSFEAIEQFSLRAPAAKFLIELAVQQALAAEDAEDRSDFIEEAKRDREVLADFVSNNAKNLLLLNADGIIALAELDYVAAANNLEEVIARSPEPTAQHYRFVAIALGETGSKGLAANRLQEAIAIEPGNLANYLMKNLYYLIAFLLYQ
mgnify:CR=1 FL=1